MDRIKRISLQILQDYKDQFGVDFVENKKILDNISTIRSKELKNELAGFITKFIKHEIRENKEKEEQKQREEQISGEEIEPKNQNEIQTSEDYKEQTKETTLSTE